MAKKSWKITQPIGIAVAISFVLFVYVFFFYSPEVPGQNGLTVAIYADDYSLSLSQDGIGNPYPIVYTQIHTFVSGGFAESYRWYTSAHSTGTFVLNGQTGKDFSFGAGFLGTYDVYCQITGTNGEVVQSNIVTIEMVP